MCVNMFSLSHCQWLTHETTANHIVWLHVHTCSLCMRAPLDVCVCVCARKGVQVAYGVGAGCGNENAGNANSAHMYNARKELSYQCLIMQKVANNYAYLVNHFFCANVHTHTHQHRYSLTRTWATSSS